MSRASLVARDAPETHGQLSRNEDGLLRQKRGDTHAGTTEQQYHVDLVVRSDKRVDSILRDERVDSLNDLLEKRR